jgi:subtilisin family serine protease
MRVKYFMVMPLIILVQVGFSGNGKVHGGGKNEDTLSYINWHNKDWGKDKIPGTGMERAFAELLPGKKPSGIIVAVIDGGMDITHRELQDHIWKNDDIPNNKIDDDHNGYIDDTCGWNFLGAADGRLVEFETLELTRLYKKYKDIFGVTSDIDSVPDSQKKDFRAYLEIKKEFDKKYTEASATQTTLVLIQGMSSKADSIIKKELGKDEYTIKEVKAIKSKDKSVTGAKKLLMYLDKGGLSKPAVAEMKKYYDIKANYHYNTDYQRRQEVIGDNPEINSNRFYGNNNVNYRADHATSVAGIIAGMHAYAKIINGISDSVHIMSVVAVPDGDERDKDVANAIRYAVDNGARVINMSFGKMYSPQKSMVDSAIKYAEEKNVLLVHAAGNDAYDVDEKIHYPSFTLNDGHKVNDGITVGASTKMGDKKMLAYFSNFGKKNVDLFSPGLKIYGLKPGNSHDLVDGTSFSSPVVSAVASVILSYYPQLTAKEVKEILMASVRKFDKKKVLIPFMDEKKRKKKNTLNELCVTGGLVDGYHALKLAEEYAKRK